MVALLKWSNCAWTLWLAALLAAACGAPHSHLSTRTDAVVAPSLGAASSFAILAGQAVTNTGPGAITGDVGVSPGSAVTGFPPGIVTGGTIHIADGPAAAAQGSLTTAYDEAAGLPCGTSLTGTDLGGLTLAAGVYCFTSSAGLTGTLTFDGGGDPNAVFVIQVASGLTTAPNAAVVLIGGASAQNVFWQIGTSAALDTGTAFVGNILALTSISLATGASNQGRCLARNGEVTVAGGFVDSTAGAQPSSDGGTPMADLAVTNSDSPDPVVVGRTLTYSLTVTNQGPAPATGVQVTDALASSVTLVSVIPTQGICTVSALTITCQLGALANGGTASVIIVVTPNTAGEISNTADVTANEADAVLENNRAIAPTTVIPRPAGSADVAVTNVDSPDPVALGAALTYTLTATNLGPDTATAVTITDVLPSGVTLVSMTPTQGLCRLTGSTVTCDLGTLLNAASATVTMVVTPTVVGSVFNTVDVAANEADPNLANNRAITETAVISPPAGSADLAVVASGSPASVLPGDVITYTLTVTNNGPDTAFGATLSNILPVAVTRVSAPAGCTGTATISCALGDIRVGDSVTISIVGRPVRVETSPTTLTNRTSVTSTIPDPNLANNTATVFTTKFVLLATGETSGCYGSVAGPGGGGLAVFLALGLLLLVWRRRRVRRGAALILLACVLVTSPAVGQQAGVSRSINVQLFQPAVGRFDLFTLESSRLPEPGLYSLGLYYNYQRDPLVLRIGRDVFERVVSDQQTANFLFSVALTRFLQVGVDLPLNIRMDGMGGQALNSGSSQINPTSFGDIRLHLKWRIVGSGTTGFGLAVATPVSFPTGGDAGFRGDPSLTFSPRLLIDYFWDRVGLVGQIGYLFRKRADFANLRFDNEILWGLGTNIALYRDDGGRDRLSLVGEVVGRTGGLDAFTDQNQNPMELLAGLRINFPNQHMALTVGAGAGLQAGYGVPSGRAFIGLQWHPAPAAPAAPRPLPPPEPVVLAPACPSCPAPRAPCPVPLACPLPPIAVEVPPPPQKVVHIIRRLRQIYFAFGKSISRTSVPIDRLVQLMKKYPTLTIRVEGHTDSVGSLKYNQALSERRANMVRDYLIEQGVDAKRVVAVGFGQERPFVDNKTSAHRSENRRVEIVFTSAMPKELSVKIRRLEF